MGSFVLMLELRDWNEVIVWVSGWFPSLCNGLMVNAECWMVCCWLSVCELRMVKILRTTIRVSFGLFDGEASYKIIIIIKMFERRYYFSHSLIFWHTFIPVGICNKRLTILLLWHSSFLLILFTLRLLYFSYSFIFILFIFIFCSFVFPLSNFESLNRANDTFLIVVLHFMTFSFNDLAYLRESSNRQHYSYFSYIYFISPFPYLRISVVTQTAKYNHQLNHHPYIQYTYITRDRSFGHSFLLLHTDS